MRINTNVAALNSYNQLSNTQENMSQSLERLSSGKRINSAADDAAGLAISEKMNAQTRGLGQAQRNAQDGISMIQTAEGALKESHSILQRMRELSVQAANDTNTADDREEIQKEVDQLTSELDRVASDTEFNTQKLLNGSKNIKATSDFTNTKIADVEATDSNLQSGDYTADVSNVTVTADDNLDAGTTGLTSSDITVDSTTDASSHTLEVSNYSSGTADLTLKDGEGNVLKSQTGTDVSTSTTIGDYSITGGSITSDGEASFDTTIEADVKVTDPSGNVDNSTGVSASLNGSEISAGGFDFEVNSDLTAATDTVSVNNDSVSYQIGSNEGQNTKVAIGDMSSSALEVKSLDLTTKDGADKAISRLDEAIGEVSAERSKLGASQNRLEHTINNLNTAEENLTAAESRISDVDMADEMMNMSKQRILKQAGTAMMAQANQMPQGVLKLLG